MRKKEEEEGERKEWDVRGMDGDRGRERID